MEGLFNAIKGTVEAAINQDGGQLAVNIVDIVQNGIQIVSKFIGA
ncbi:MULTISPECIES: beta-class phenol-soluble modulin [Staphylococcus]|uniref:Beta-class phenol-soluble modulin n=5 Tax=Staphylococcus TaxID=1279 RepID=A0AB37HCV7_9STAP|nr:MULTISPECIES: beta-class phenol-soluble modulin [Staphylococcus]AMY05042.1 phenol soluble modulin [Staphylococcus condimenti]ANZ33627.1 phenol soluble modulin [Staphylococcus carnosus]APR61291.1 phenol soluble modulin [Staphylococcus condimenti]KKB26543.1 phenol soluble modulin [Staphylococcus carnosus]KOR13924.1 phenol soluble modulin [Staphylococcus carnosus]